MGTALLCFPITVLHVWQRVCCLDFAVAGLQEGQFGYQVQVQSFRRRCNLYSRNVLKLLVSDFGWYEPTFLFAGTSHAKGIVVEKIGIEAKQ